MIGYTTVDTNHSSHIEESVQERPKTTLISRCTELYASRTWKPLALRAPILILTTTICWSLIAVLEYLLWRSQKDNGIIFAPKISDLPLRRTFSYQYLPTIIAVIFSIYWAWIDLETKRMEPYYQLSIKEGALGKDSILLHYPFDFIPLVPLKAFRNRHWPVFWASFAVGLVTWGLVPTQAGIFSVQTVTLTTNTTFAVSRSPMPFEKQRTNLTYRYAQSTYGIVALNETLPAFMARNYTLAPFKPLSSQGEVLGQGTYTSLTTMYYLDLHCEQAPEKIDDTGMRYYMSNKGCTTNVGLSGNKTFGDDQGDTKTLAMKEYIGMYIGYHNEGFADYYLSNDCPKDANTTFYAAFTKTKAREQDPPNNVTAIFCETRYWQQEVSATIDIHTKAPVKIEALEDKRTLPWDVLNITMFESLLNVGTIGANPRGDILPTMQLPDYWETVAGTNLSLTASGGGMISPMVGLTVSVAKKPLGEFLDWTVLSKAYADSYRLLFARAMVDVLGSDFGSARTTTGQQRVTTEAVTLVPVFVHIVVGFLAMISISTIALLIISFVREWNLRTDPSTIASVMALVADNQSLLLDFANLDCCTIEDMQEILKQKRYKLINDGTGANLIEISHVGDAGSQAARIIALVSQRRNSPTSIAKPVRPKEFSLWAAFPFINLFVALAIVLAVLFSKARTNGLPLPSSNKIVQNIIENYIPTAVATLIEPMWVLINRLLCMLQPLEELQKCNARATKSIDLNYASLPPQLVVFKALRSKHFVLAAVCTMALLANVLAVAFAGIFNQGSFHIGYTTSFQLPFDLKVVPINGSIGPSTRDGAGTLAISGAYEGGNGEDQFLIADSNFSRNTPLPPWVDANMFYLPLFSESGDSTENTTRFKANVRSIGAQLQCDPLVIGESFNAEMVNQTISTDWFTSLAMNISIPSDMGTIACTASNTAVTVAKDSMKGPGAIELVTGLEPRANATQKEQDVCTGIIIFGWMRDVEGSYLVNSTMKVNNQNSMFVRCRPTLYSGVARILVDVFGRLQSPADNIELSEIEDNHYQKIFASSPIDIIRQSSLYIFKSSGSIWHSDSYASHFIHYFVTKTSNTRRFVDPNTPLPKFDEIVEPLKQAYSSLFAIWLGKNKQKLFMPIEGTKASAEPVLGTRVEQEMRLFLSTTMFILSEAILCTYVFVALWVYLRRPGQYLARLPTSIASVVALFAASTAVIDMQGTAHMDRKERAQHLKNVNARYGYGSFIGGDDGRVHIGIEKQPFIRKRTKATWFDRKVTSFRTGS